MARSKQTARAEARRRTREANRPLEADPALDTEGEDDEQAAAAPTNRRAQAAGGRTEIPRRPGFRGLFTSFSAAYRRPDVREDVRALPKLLLSRGFLAAIGLILIGAVAFAIFPGYSGSTFIFQFLTFPPALAPIFVAGFFAPRGGYLLGLIVGLFDAVVYSIWLIAALPSLGAAASPDQIGLYVLTAVFWSAVTGIVFGGGAAWYRRFLQLTSPRRQAQARGQSGRGQTGRRAAATSGRRRY